MRLYLGLGSNLGDRAFYLVQAVRWLAQEPGMVVLRRSSVYETEAIGPVQPAYLNAVVEIETTLEPVEVLQVCKAIEQKYGRPPGGQRWGPRTLDIDLLMGDAIVNEPQLQVPHAELHNRAFAIVPLLELIPKAVHPILKRSLKDLLGALHEQKVTKFSELI